MTKLQTYAARLWPFGAQVYEPLSWDAQELSTRIGDVDYVVFDTELTGLDRRRDSIVSIGAVRMKGGRLRLADNFYRVADPRTAIEGRSVLIHGITPSEASRCPQIEMILPEFLEFCRGAVLVGHYVSLDLHFLGAEIERHMGSRLSAPALDTASLYRWWMRQTEQGCAFYEGGNSRMDLLSVARSFGIKPSESHHALADALVTAQVLQRFLSLLPGMGINSLGELLRIGKP